MNSPNESPIRIPGAASEARPNHRDRITLRNPQAYTDRGLPVGCWLVVLSRDPHGVFAYPEQGGKSMYVVYADIAEIKRNPR